MFVEQSAARIRLVRTLFVCVCLLPSLGLTGWALYRHSATALDPLLAGWSRSIGYSITVDQIEHLRPSVMRMRNLVLKDNGTRQIISVALAEVEERAEGTLVRLPELAVDRHAAVRLAAAARQWLMEPVRFPQGGAVRVGDFSWNTSTASRSLGGFLAEFVVAAEGRAIRIRREPADGDELRLRVIHAPDGPRVEVELSCERGLPAELAAVVCGWLPDFGSDAMVRGRLQATAAGSLSDDGLGPWSGSGEGVVVGVDLTVLAGAAGQTARGEGLLQIESLALEGGRITAASFLLSAENGSLGRELLERLVTVFACRLGPAAPQMVGADWLAGPALAFDEAAFALQIDRTGVLVAAAGLGGNTLVASRGLSLLEAAGRSISYERFAWFFAPAASELIPATIPASPRALEVLSRLPIGAEPPSGHF
jgi:hypothetical protein